jgi:hypothetical protein
MNLKIDADALNRRRVAFVPGLQYIISLKDSEGSLLVSANRLRYMQCEE